MNVENPLSIENQKSWDNDEQFTTSYKDYNI